MPFQNSSETWPKSLVEKPGKSKQPEVARVELSVGRDLCSALPYKSSHEMEDIKCLQWVKITRTNITKTFWKFSRRNDLENLGCKVLKFFKKLSRSMLMMTTNNPDQLCMLCEVNTNYTSQPVQRSV